METAPITLVIPLRNEEENVGATMSNIAAQTLQPAEIIFVDGGSEDQTAAKLRELTAGDARFKVLEIGAATPGRGRNFGIAAATQPWIAFTDAGIRLDRDWLRHLWQVAVEEPQADFILGNLTPDNQSYFEECAALAYVPKTTLIKGENWCGPWIPSSMVKKSVSESIGNFPDLRAAEDLIFMERIRERGFVTSYAPKAMVYWRLRRNLTETFQRFALYSKHNAWAGRQKFWHYGILRQYLIIVPLTLLGFIFKPLFVVPLLWIILRTAKNLWQKRNQHSLLWLFNPFRFAFVAVILLAIDLATFYGWWQASVSTPC